LGGEDIRTAHLGVGPAAAAKSIQLLLAQERPRMLICAGFAGGLDPRVRAGDVVVADNFSTAELRGRARELTGARPHHFFGPLVTRQDPVEAVDAKAALAAETGALAVDMETGAVAEACLRAAVPLLAVRAISDGPETALPVPFAHWFDLERQRPRPWALVKYLAQNPGQVVPFVHFVRGLSPAREALADFLFQFLSRPTQPRSF